MKNELTAKRMQLALSNANMIPQELAEKSGVSKSSISQYVNGSHAPSNISSGKIGKVLDVNPLWLMGFDVDMKESIIAESPEEIEKEKFDKYKNIVDKYHFISTHSPDGASVVDTVLDREYAIAQHIQEKDKRIKELEDEIAEELMPYSYLGNIACAGTGFYFDDIPTEIIKAPYMDGADFVIGVSGESMEPDYHNGEKLYVRKVEYLRNGDVGIFTIGNECFLKELGENGLISRNKDYDDIPGDEKVRLIGKVIGKVED